MSIDNEEAHSDRLARWQGAEQVGGRPAPRAPHPCEVASLRRGRPRSRRIRARGHRAAGAIDGPVDGSPVCSDRSRRGGGRMGACLR